MKRAPVVRSVLPSSARRLARPSALAFVLVVGGCSAFHHERPAAPPLAPAAAPADAGVPSVETIPFHTGVSSATVEKMARQNGCTGGQGAALVTEPGPVEVYRMRCDDKRVFMARCELRQCKRM